MSRWASPVVDGEGLRALEAAQSLGPVALIATPRQALQCRPARDWKAIANDPTLDDFDQVPLTAPDSANITSVFIRGQGRTALSADMFMAADAPLLAFVETADTRRYRLLVSGGAVVGMVTLSDLQRLPVFSLLFSLHIAVEVLLVEWIRGACAKTPDIWMEHLHPKQRTAIKQHWQRTRDNNLGLDMLSCASFSHEINAARGLGLFNTQGTRESELNALKALRDRVCHAMEFAPTAEHALQVPAQARKAVELAQWLIREISKQA